MTVLVLVAVGAFLVVWQVGKLGDDLNGWLQVKDRWLDWRDRHDRRATPYLWAVAAVVVVYVAIRVPAARGLAQVGTMTAAALAWAMARQAMRLWPLLALITAACLMVQARQRKMKWLRGEDQTPRGEARAALLHLTRRAVAEALKGLQGREGRTPTAGAVSFFSTTVGGRTKEWGVRVRLHMAYGMRIADLRKATSDGMDPEQDTLATNTAHSLSRLFAEKGPEARIVLAASKRQPVYTTTALVPVRLKDGSPHPAEVDLLLLRSNPLRQKYPYPARRPKVAHLGQPILCGLDIQGGPARITLREAMTGVYGASGSGKSYWALNVAIGASQCPNVAFVVIDMKGDSGDFASLWPRSAAVATDLGQATVTLEWLRAELARRQALPGQRGKITKFSRDLPEIVVWADEWHEWAYHEPTKEDAESRMKAMARLVRRARAFGIYFVAVTQIAHAKDIPTAITGQFHNVVSTRLGKREHSEMVFSGQLPNGVGPHLIRPDMKGVAYGRFGEGGKIGMIKSLLSGPHVAAEWMERDAKAGLRVELPGLVGALEARPEAERVLATVAAPARSGARVVASLPADVLAAVRECWAVLDVDEPAEVTERELRDLLVKARRAVHNAAGATEARKAEFDAQREIVRRYLSPTD